MALKGRWLVNMTWLATMFTLAAANHITQATPCTDGDTFPHPSGNCTKYLVCASGSLHDQNCITGLNFDPHSHACVWPSQYACPTTTTTTTTTTPYTGTGTPTTPRVTSTTACTHGQSYVHPSGDCTRYLTCSNGMLVEKSCIVGLNFSPDDGNCVWPSNYACPTTTTTTTTTAPYTGTGSTTPRTVIPTTPGVTSTTTCTNGQSYVHPSGDCNRYLSCANGMLLEQLCGPGLVFHPDGNSCVWPSDYTCPTTTATTTTTAPYKGTVTSTTPGVRSTTTCTNGQNYVHPSGDCTIYLTCSNGMLVETSCTAGLNFSPIDGNCVWANQYACPTTTTTTTPMAPYTGTGTPFTPAVTSTTTCNHGQSYVHPSGDCTRYLTCSNSILLDDSCTEGLNYSPDENYCVWPSQYACPTITSSTTKAISYTETGTTTTASTAPYTWTDTRATKPTTRNTTTAPYTGTGSTTPRTVTPTTPGVTSTTTCTHDGQNYVHPYGDCNRYLTCSNGMILEKSCSTGLNFNPYENICVLPSQYSCLTITTPMTSAGAHFQHSLGLFTLLLFYLLHLKF